MKVREPVARPLDVVAVELLLSASQAFVTGVLMYLAIGIWDDRGVGAGPVAVILALLGLAVGGSWLYWLLGGTGWPMAAANVPAAMFLGFTLILGWQGDGIISLDALPLLLALAASIYGVVCGVFLDSPRRWRWDQRRKLRAGTDVPRVSPTTRALVARVPRSLPRREPRPSGADLPIPPPGPEPDKVEPSGDVGIPYASAGGSAAADETSRDRPVPGEGRESRDDAGGADGVERAGPALSTSVEAPEETPAPDHADRADKPADEEASGPIELPTSIEPKAQRSPWAWAAPPEWNRDEDDQPDDGGSRP